MSMKTLSILSILAAALAVTTVQAAPAISPSDISEETLKNIGTERQKASLDAHAQAKAKVEKERAEAAQEAKEITSRNDDGLKKTIQKRSLNNMLPACEREPEMPRDPGPYKVRY